YSIARPAPPADVRQVDYCSAASLLVRRAAWEEVGGFDEGYYPAYYEDVDLCLKLQDRGWHVLYQPASVIRHRQGASASLRYRRFLRDRNVERLRARWPRLLAERPAPGPRRPDAVARALRLAGNRPAVVGSGPSIPDERPPTGPEEEAWYRRRQQEIEGGYAAALEADRRAAPSSPWGRAAHAGASAMNRLLRRHWPAAHRALARRLSRGAGPD
ncbi:MAG TPA: glycosyltransferase, partial [Acidimicrobiales bacterium]|nr:glycosyltransferase [Acidimicrobiales bacterium]